MSNSENRQGPEQARETLLADLPGMAFRRRLDGDWRLEDASDEVEQISGFSVAEFRDGHVNWLHLLHPEDLPRVRAVLERAIGERRPYQVEYRIHPRQGGERWLWEQGRGLFDATGLCIALEGFDTDISELKRDQEALAGAKRLLDAHMENSPLAVIEFDTQLRVIRWSQEAEQLFGWRAEEALNRHIEELHWVHDEDVERVQRLSEDMLANRSPRNRHVNRNYRKNGSVVVCEWYNSAVHDDAGKLTSILSQVLDITERKHAEQRMAEHEVLLNRLQEIADLGFLELDRVHDRLTLSEAACCILGVLPREECTDYAALLQRIHPDDRARVDQAFTESVAEAGETFEFSHRVIRGKVGDIREVRARCEHFRDASGRVIRIVCILHDITQQLRAAEALRESEARLSALMDHVPAPIQGYDTDGYITYWNRASEQVYGYTAEEAMGRHLNELIIPEALQPLVLLALEACKHLTESGEFLPAGEIDLRHKDGSTVPVYSTHTAICRAGHPPMLFCLDMDLTARRRVEQELALSRLQAEQRAAELDALLQAVPAAVWIAHDAECRRVTGNRTAYEWVQLPMGTEISLAVPEGGLPPYLRFCQAGRVLQVADLPLLQAAAGFEVRDCELDIVLDTGGQRTTFGHATPLRDDQGQPRGAIAAFVDITERKRAEESLRNADRRKNEFLALLAHELRNPLAPIRNAVAVMRLKGSPDPDLVEARNLVDRQLQFLVRLVDDLLDVSRITHGKLQLRRETVLLAVVLGQALEAARPLLDTAGLTLEISLPTQPVLMDADPARLAQVFMNLLNNAVKYTAPGGRVELSAAREAAEVVVRVRDSGIGIPPESLPELFEMFSQLPSSQENKQGGLGLGLALARELVKMHGGQIEARSEGLGHGSEFLVRLPILAAEPVRTAAAPKVEEAHCGGVRILVADDKPDAVESLLMLLRISGHEVETAIDGIQAVEVAARYRPEVVLLDIGMPRLNGYEACRRIRELPGGADMQIFALTGWGQEEDLRNSRAAGFTGHLIKPVDPVVLLGMLADLHGGQSVRAG